MKKIKQIKAFSLIELSIVLLIVGIVLAGLTQASRLINEFRLTSAQNLSKSSDISSISGLVLWFDATNAKAFLDSETDDGGYISRWNSFNPQLSGEKYVEQTGANTMRPRYDKDGMNNLPALSFDSGDYLIGPSFDADLNPDQYALFVVFRVSSSAGNYSDIISTRYILNPVYRGFYLGADPGIYVNYIHNGTATNSSINKNSNRGKIELLTMRYNGTSNIMGLNGATETVSSFSSYAPNVSLPLVVGGYVSNPSTTPVTIASGWRFNGHIGEIIMFNRSLKSEEVTAVNTYLKKKWGIT